MSLLNKKKREASVTRETGETNITVKVGIDGNGQLTGQTGIGFFDHMLNLLAVHSGMDLDVMVTGDLEVDNHHTLEDLGLTLGEAIREALGEKKGINRYGTFFCPMDETLVRCVLDFSGRPYLVYDVDLTVERIGDFETEMLREFLLAIAVSAKCNLHVACLYGVNNHHKVEAVFKALAHAIKEAVTISDLEGRVLSSKGVL